MLPLPATPSSSSPSRRRLVRVALDVRVLQGEDAFRGIGYYTRGLTEALLGLAASGEAREAGVEYVLLVDAARPRPELCTAGAAGLVEVVTAPGNPPPRGDRNEETHGSSGPAVPAVRAAGHGWLDCLSERLTGCERGAAALIRAVQAARARVLHVASPLHGPFPWARWRGGRTVATFYDLIPLLQAAEFLDRWPPEVQRRYRRRVARLAQIDALFAISQSAAEEAVAHAGVARERVHVAYPGLRDIFLRADAPPPGPAADPDSPGVGERFTSQSPGITDAQGDERVVSGDAGTAHGLQAAAPYVLAFGSPNPSKNTPLLLEAWRRLSPRARDGHVLRLVVPAGGDAADAPWAGESSVLAAPAPADGALAGLYARAACFVCPSRAEGFGLPPLEAAASGAPVVASDIAVLREVLGGAAEFFASDSAEALAGALARVLADAPLRAGLSVRGQARAREFTWQRTARAVMREHARLGD